MDLGLGQPMEHVLRSWLIAARLGERRHRSGASTNDSAESIGGLLVTEVRKTNLDQLRDMLIVEGIKDDLPRPARRDQLQRAEDS